MKMGKRDSEFLFLESMCLQYGTFPLWDYHYRRMQATLQEFFGEVPPWLAGFGPADILGTEAFRLFGAGSRFGKEGPVPASLLPKTKCRLFYGQWSWKAEFQAYEPRRIGSLRWVDAPLLDYHLKYADRHVLEELHGQRDGCDEILIGQDGLLTDTPYSNVVLYDGSDYYTPVRCLLAGTRRHSLLDAGRIRPVEIRRRDLDAFCRIFLINALLDLDDGLCVEMGRVLR